MPSYSKNLIGPWVPTVDSISPLAEKQAGLIRLEDLPPSLKSCLHSYEEVGTPPEKPKP